MEEREFDESMKELDEIFIELKEGLLQSEREKEFSRDQNLKIADKLESQLTEVLAILRK